MTDLTEFTFMDTDELHLVGTGANGFPQLMLKEVEDILHGDITQQDAVALATKRNAERIEKAAAVRAEEMIKAKYNQDDRDKMAGNGQAMKDGSYPIADAADLSNAIHAVGRGNAPHDSIRAHIVKRAKALGLSDKIPDSWGSGGSMKKAMQAAVLDAITTLTDAKAEMDSLIKAMPEAVRPTPNNPDAAAGDPNEPGSPAWEANDAARLIAAGQVITTALSIVNAACEREQMEVATGHADDSQDVWDLQNATDALNCALSIVARISFTEEHEGQMTDVAKGLVSMCEDKIRAALAGDNQPDSRATVSKTTSEEVVTMELSEQELDERITKASEEAVAKYAAGLDELKKAEDEKATAEQAEADRLAKEKADAETAEAEKVKAEEIAKAAAEDEEKKAEEAALAKAAEDRKAEVSELVKAAVSPLEDKLDTLLAQPRFGGPKLMTPRGGPINIASGIAALNDRLEKSTDPLERQDLQERVARAQLAVMAGAEPEDAVAKATATLR